MGVYIAGGGYLGMTQTLADGPNIHVGRDHETGTGMTEPVDIDIREAMTLQELIKPSGESVGVHGLTFPGGKQPPAVFPSVPA